jgi:predicted transcriptional regulator of viral defense system
MNDPRSAGLPPTLLQRPLAVIRPQDATAVYRHPRPEIARLTQRGLLHRLAAGYYAIVPRQRVGDDWLPELEAAAAGIGTARYGWDSVVLMGISAARLHGAIPRALGVAVVAAPTQAAEIELVDRDARVIFVQRDTGRLDAERMMTELGPALVTGPEQTVLDLAHRPDLGGVSAESREAVQALLPRCDPDLLEQLAAAQRLRAPLRRAREWAA